jgi:hypothetical protein
MVMYGYPGPLEIRPDELFPVAVLVVSHTVMRSLVVGSSNVKSLDEYDMYIETFLPGSPSALVSVMGHVSFAFMQVSIMTATIDSKIRFIIRVFVVIYEC